MTTKDFRDILLGVTPQVFHYEAFKAEGEFVVWQEIVATPTVADGRHVLRTQRVQVDAYSPDEYSTLPDALALTFEAHGLGYTEPHVSWENESRLTRWRFDVYIVG